jgi:hypothetical protein
VLGASTNEVLKTIVPRPGTLRPLYVYFTSVVRIMSTDPVFQEFGWTLVSQLQAGRAPAGRVP